MKTIAKEFEAEINIKKSRFICRIFPARDSHEAKKIIQRIANKYADATHNCSAYLTQDSEGYDDDGEPGGTAGRPILNALKKNELENIVAIVTRYFGGIKLGAGGLVRAYSKSTIETIAIAEIVEMDIYKIYKIIFDYNNVKDIDNEIRNYNIRILNKKYTDKVIYKIAIKEAAQLDSFTKKFNLNMKVNFLCEEYLN
ncbi:IMPACT family member YigZ [Methanobrevibacter cuticularis]|uniref:IMPACT family member YigZ n=1 Tax=Methanobrevibacter cuticularis TaxID=47311 RepID=A0A166DI06_9EURY|nr:YigZ family protein [Methanobrevibacter cuticularis]KZX15620.1 IMPACT family member YigZ [Methanobrevibacter cuticularis]